MFAEATVILTAVKWWSAIDAVLNGRPQVASSTSGHVLVAVV